MLITAQWKRIQGWLGWTEKPWQYSEYIIAKEDSQHGLYVNH